MKTLPLFAALTLLMTATPMAAETQVYRWTDQNGVRHYGGTPPPGAKYDVLRPGGAAAAAVPSGTGAGAPAAGAPPIDEATKKFIEEADKANQAKAEAQAKAKQEKAEAAIKCAEARERHKFLEERTARRLVATTPEGELTRMDQDEFLKRLGAAQKAIDENCH